MKHFKIKQNATVGGEGNDSMMNKALEKIKNVGRSIKINRRGITVALAFGAPLVASVILPGCKEYITINEPTAAVTPYSVDLVKFALYRRALISIGDLMATPTILVRLDDIGMVTSKGQQALLSVVDRDGNRIATFELYPGEGATYQDNQQIVHTNNHGLITYVDDGRTWTVICEKVRAGYTLNEKDAQLALYVDKSSLIDTVAYKLSASGTIGVGDAGLKTALYAVKLGEVNSGTEGNYARVDISSKGLIIGQIQVLEGQIYTYTESSSGRSLKVHVGSIDLNNNRAYVEVWTERQ